MTQVKTEHLEAAGPQVRCDGLMFAELGVAIMQFLNFCQANDAWLCHRSIGEPPEPLDPLEIIRLVIAFKQLGR